jgi:Fe-S-cluster-containing dehydrogenase component
MALRPLPVVAAASSAAPQNQPLWRSFAEAQRGGPDPVEAKAEFAASADVPADATGRRTFVQLLGAGAALAGLSGCVSKTKEQALPFTRQVEGHVAGKARHYATATFLGGHATGLLVTSHDGRPTKIEGNPEHPSSLGATGLIDQALLASLYDPTRASVIKEKGKDRSQRAFLTAMLAKAAELKKGEGAGLRFLVEPSASPLLGSLRERIRAELPKARFYAYSPLSGDGQAEAFAAAFGGPVDARHELAEAKVIASLDEDFLSGLPGTLALQRGFAKGRAPGEEMSRLYVIEPGLTPTGGSADHRAAAKPSEIPLLAAGLLARVARLSQKPELAPFASLSAATGAHGKFLDALAKDLVQHAGRSVVLAGARQPASVHAAALAINAALGNAGKTVHYAKSSLLDAESGPKALAQLAAEIKAGKVDTLFVTAWNPVYTAPADLEFEKLLKAVPTSVYLGAHEDETAPAATWFVPAAHAMEQWGDGRALDGTVTFAQPLIAPLFNGLSPAELLASLLGEGDKGGLELLRAHWDKAARPTPQQWEKWLSDGFAAGTASPAGESPKLEPLAPLLQRLPAPLPGLEVFFAVDHKVYDGRFGNNAWLQEVPHPVTRLSWDNAALVSKPTAVKLGLADGAVIDVKVKDGAARGAVMVQPGQAHDTVQLNLGYGRGEVLATFAEATAHKVGSNAGLARSSSAFWSGAAEVLAVGREHTLVTTQEHHSMEGRALALQTTLEALEKKETEHITRHAGPLPTLYDGAHKYEGFKWAMAIDLNQCTGCNACALACQAENNISVVGKEQVGKSREMHWLRVDRYYMGDGDFPEMITQPVMCVQCENAPCEYVCPVNATVHSDEGINDMVYNRCVGTRYCSNNCPYKVRRFNFFSYTSNFTDVEKMVMNPDVTVRARGVMEKCTYCVQRIERARIDTRVAGSTIKDGDVVTACQQACPSRAISFGSLHDPASQVSKQHNDPRRYDLLHELGTRPRTAYLARVKNLNPELA